MDDTLEQVDEMIDDDETGEIPVHGVLALEGVPTDGTRVILDDALSMRTLPIALRYEFVGSHGGDTSHVATVGRVDEIWKDGNIFRYRGVIAQSARYAEEVIDGIAGGWLRGVSIDGDRGQATMAADPENPGGKIALVSSLRIAGLTIVAIPAIEETYIALGESEPTEEEIEQAESILAAAACGCTDSFTAMQENPGLDEAQIAGNEEASARTGTLIVLYPSEQSPVHAASSEDEAHLTFVWMGSTQDADYDLEGILEEVSEYASEASGSITVPVRERGLLGDEDADVIFLEPTESLVAFRDGLLQKDEVRGAYEGAEQFDQWIPHVTLGYPEGVENGPATGDFSDEEIEFDRIGVWIGEERFTFTLGESAPAAEEIIASAREAFAPGTKDGPGWLTHPRETARIRRYWTRGKGAAKIRWGAPGDFNRCRKQLAKYVRRPDWLAGTCANMHKEATGVWPGRHNRRRGRFAADTVTASAAGEIAAPLVRMIDDSYPTDVQAELRVEALLASAESAVYDSALFANPNFTAPTPLTIDLDTGRVYGHIAAWGVCHIGIPGICQEAPRSSTAYSLFKTGTVDTTDGPIRVGKLTSGVGHPNPKWRASRATAHYDRTDAVRAYVNIGEDPHGIWYSGVLAPGLSPEQIQEFRAIGQLSGDWRPVRGQLELIAAVAVNTPGFPIPSTQFAVADGTQLSLIAAGVVPAADVERDLEETRAMRAFAAKQKFNRTRLASMRAVITGGQ